VHWSEVWLFKLWARLMQHPRFYTWATRLAGWMQKPLARQGWIGKLPPPFHGWTQSRDFKAAAPVSFRRRWQQTLQHERAMPSGRWRDG
jgi:L-lactate dehydrogenase complex protein LldF